MVDSIKKYSTGFTQVPNWVLCDKNLSARAKGIYAYLFSKPDGWQFRTSIIENELKESIPLFRAAIKELIASGYVRRTQVNENGVFGGVVYEFIPYRDTKNRATEKPCSEKPCYGKPEHDNNIYNINNTEYINNTEINNPYTQTKVCEFPQGGTTDRCSVDWNFVLEKWNSIAEHRHLAKMRSLTPQRKKAFLQRLKQLGTEDPNVFFAEIDKALGESMFLLGKRITGFGENMCIENTDWRADFDFFLQARSFQRAIEGGYADPDLRK